MHREARRDGVDPHAVGRGLDRRAPRQRHDARLRRRVVRLPGLGAPAEHRRVVHDHARAAAGTSAADPARRHRNVPLSVTSSTVPHCSSVMSTRSAVPPSPALFTSTSIRPCSRDGGGDEALHVLVLGDVADDGERSRAGAGRELLGRLAEAPLVVVADRRPSRPPRWQRFAVANPMPVPAAAVTSDDLVRPAARAPAVSGGDAIVIFGSFGQAERALADDVALDLVRPAVDRVGAGVEEQPLQRGQLSAPVADAVPSAPSTSTASSPSDRWKFAQHSLRIDVSGRDLPVLERAQRAQRVEPHACAARSTRRRVAAAAPDRLHDAVLRARAR